MTADNFCFHLQNSLILASQTGGQWYSDTSPFRIPCLDKHTSLPQNPYVFIVQAPEFMEMPQGAPLK